MQVVCQRNVLLHACIPRYLRFRLTQVCGKYFKKGHRLIHNIYLQLSQYLNFLSYFRNKIINKILTWFARRFGCCSSAFVILVQLFDVNSTESTSLPKCFRRVWTRNYGLSAILAECITSWIKQQEIIRVSNLWKSALIELNLKITSMTSSRKAWPIFWIPLS